MNKQQLLLAGSMAAIIWSSQATAQATSTPAGPVADPAATTPAAPHSVPPGSTAPAPDQAAPPAQPTTDAAPSTDGDIVVTAQRRAESSQRVPISITAFSGSTLKEANITTLTEIQKLTPGLTIARFTQTANLRTVIRGIVSSSGTALEPSTATFLDGIYVPRSGAIVGNLVDVEAVEVLRGPQGTLFGRNASIGAISIRTADPGDKFGGYITGTAARYNRFRGEGAIDLPASDTLAFRVAGAVEDYGGDFYATSPTRHRLGKANSQLGRVTMVWKPTDAIRWRVKGDYQHLGGDGQGFNDILPETIFPGNTFSQRLDPDGPGPLVGPPATDGDAFDRETNAYQFGHIYDRVWGLTSDFSYEFGNGLTAKLISGYRNWKSRPSETYTIPVPVPLVQRTQLFQSKAHSEELQLLSPDRQLLGGHLDFVIGGYFYRERYDLNVQWDLLGSYCNGFISNILPARLAGCLAGPKTGAAFDSFDQVTKSYAAYTQATGHITDTLDVTFGIRYTHDRKDALMFQVRNNSAELLHTNETTPLEQSGSKVTYRAGVQWYPLQRVMVFATYSTGYKGGGFNSSFSGTNLGQQRKFGPESVKNYEAGVKSTLFDGLLRANLTLYRDDIDGLQDNAFTGAAFNPTNVGSLRQQGAEYELVLRPARRVQIGTSGAYLDSEFLDYRNGPCLPAIGGVCNRTGTRAYFSPRWSITNFAQLDGALGGDWTWAARIDHRYQSSAFIGSQNDGNPQTLQPSYNVIGARLSVTSPGDAWQVAVYGDNITGENYCLARPTQTLDSVQGVRNPATGGTAIRCYTGAPRTYGVQLTRRF